MHAILTEDGDNTTLIKIVERHSVTGVEAVNERYLANFALDAKTLNLLRIAEDLHDRLNSWGYRTTGVWQLKDGIGKVSLERIPPAELSEADVMLASSQTMALYALKACDKARAEASVGNRDYTKNHTYMRARAALDAHCEQLAQLMWVRKVQEAKAGGKTVLGVPSSAEAEKYLRGVVDKKEA